MLPPILPTCMLRPLSFCPVCIAPACVLLSGGMHACMHERDFTADQLMAPDLYAEALTFTFIGAQSCTNSIASAQLNAVLHHFQSSNILSCALCCVTCICLSLRLPLLQTSACPVAEASQPASSRSVSPTEHGCLTCTVLFVNASLMLLGP